MKSTVFASLGLAILATGCASVQETISVREALLQAAREQDPKFPDGEHAIVIQFAYIGHVETVDGPIHIVDMSGVLTGMMAPRGLGGIMFFSASHDYLGTLSNRNWPVPLWCADGRLYFQGRSGQLPSISGGRIYNGNALDLSNGWDKRRMIDVVAYGSSGGVEDQVPTEEEREAELRAWDDK